MNSGIEITLLGTGGGRFATITQKRHTAGIRIISNSLNLHLDPGPGALVYSVSEGLDPQKLNAVFVSHCFDKETEILTEDGWKLFKNLKDHEKVATLNPDTNKIKYQNIIRKISYPYQGKLYHLKTRYLNMKVIPEHNHYVRTSPTKHEFELVKTKEVFGKWKVFKKDGIWKGRNEKYFVLPSLRSETKFFPEKKILMNNFLKFLGFYIAEGHCNDYCTRITQNPNSPFYKEIIGSIKSIGYEPEKYKRIISISSKQLANYLKEFGKHAETKRVPKFVKSLSSSQIRIFLDSLFKGDACLKSGRGKTIRFASTSKRLIDDVQELLLKSNSAGNITFRKSKIMTCPRTGKNYQSKKIWKIVALKKFLEVADRHRSLGLAKGSIEIWEKYSGMVYSVEVPNHIIYVRRNGKPCWSGNCHPDHYTDAEVLIEAMTRGMTRRRGVLAAARSVLSGNDVCEPSISKYHQRMPERKIEAVPNMKFQVADVDVSVTEARHTDPDTVGFRFEASEFGDFAYASETEYFEGIGRYYEGARLLILCVMRPAGKPWKGHMTTDDAIKIIEEAHPEQAVLTHFGMRMIFRGPAKEARLVEEKTGIPTIAAVDGMRITFGETIRARVKGREPQEGLNRFF